MADNPPYMNAYGNIIKIFSKIRAAQTPERFTTDYLATVLGFTGGGARPFIPLAKRLGFLSPDGTPTDLYRRFRGTEDQSRAAMAEAIRKAYPQLYKRNEYAHRLTKKDLQGLLTEITGMEANSPTVSAMVGSFEALKSFANFDGTPLQDSENETSTDTGLGNGASDGKGEGENAHGKGIGLRLGYTITLNLPDTNDITVFNAIFKSLKENLLS